jgi:hypothetical protein
MTLPEQMPTDSTDRRILGEFYDQYKDNQWFERAELILNHPRQMRKTLEIHAKYNPILQMKEIIAFTSKYNLGMEVVDLSH